MKKIFLILLLITLYETTLLCQQEEMRWDAKFALGGGFAAGWVFPNFDEINKMIPQFGVDKFTSSGFFTTGGLGHISIAIVKNVRVGIMGFGGSISSKGMDDLISKEAKYSTSVLGFTAEYTFPFISYVAVSAGVVIGGGSTSIELFQHQGSYDWNNLWSVDNTLPIDNSLYPYTQVNKKISHSYFTVTPTLNVEYPFNRFLAIRIGGGYIIDLGKTWELDNGQTISNVPSGLNSNALYIQAGIMIGYFNY